MRHGFVTGRRVPSGDNTNTDTTGAIRSEPNTDLNRRYGDARFNKDGAGTVDDRTHTFMNDAALGGMAEVEISKLAKDRH
jgi:putative membrane protein